MKKKIIITVGVLFLILGGLVIAPNLIDWNSYKPQLASGVEAATGQVVKFEGDLSFKLLPSPALRASNVSLANWPGGEAENFLEMEGLDIRLELFPLLSGDVKITSLVVDGGKIFLERDLEGNANWEALFEGDEAAPEPEEEGAFEMESFLLSATDVYYSDARDGFSASVLNINADLIITSLSGPFTGSGDLEYRGVAIDFTFATGLFGEGVNVPLRVGLVPGGDEPGLNFQGTFVQGNFLPSPALRASNVSLANWPGGEAENFLEMEGLDIRLELFPLLSGDVKITSLVVDGGKIFLERDLEGNANWEALFEGDEAAPEPEEEGAFEMESFLLSATDVYYSDARDGFSASVLNINADLIITSLSGPFTGSGDLEYRGVAIDFTFATGLFGEGVNVPLRVGLVPGGDEPGLNFQGTFVQEASVTALSGSFVGEGQNALPLITLISEITNLEETPVGPWENAYKVDTNLLLVLTEEKTDLVLDPLNLTLGATNVGGPKGQVQSVGHQV